MRDLRNKGLFCFYICPTSPIGRGNGFKSRTGVGFESHVGHQHGHMAEMVDASASSTDVYREGSSPSMPTTNNPQGEDLS